MSFEIKAITPGDRAALIAAWVEDMGTDIIVSRGIKYDLAELPGFVAWQSDGDERAIAGIIVFHRNGGSYEVVSLDAYRENAGVGSALLDAVVEVARAEGAERLWLITTNDNIRAIRFYQRRGWDMVAVHRFAVDDARERLKPQIPLIGKDGLRMRHEVEFEFPLHGEG